MLGSFRQSKAGAFLQSKCLARTAPAGKYSALNVQAVQTFYGLTPWAAWQQGTYSFDTTDSGGLLSTKESYWGPELGTASYTGSAYVDSAPALVIDIGAHFYRSNSRIETRTPKRYLTRECNYSATGLKYEHITGSPATLTNIDWSAYSKQTIDSRTGIITYTKLTVTIGGTTTTLCDGSLDPTTGLWSDANVPHVLAQDSGYRVNDVVAATLTTPVATVGPGSYGGGGFNIDSGSGTIAAGENTVTFEWSASCHFTSDFGGGAFTAICNFSETWSDSWLMSDCYAMALALLDRVDLESSDSPRYQTEDGTWHTIPWAANGATATVILVGWGACSDNIDGNVYFAGFSSDPAAVPRASFPPTGWAYIYKGVTVVSGFYEPSSTTPDKRLFMINRGPHRNGQGAIASKMRVWIPYYDLTKSDCWYVMPLTACTQNTTTAPPNPPYSSDDGHYTSVDVGSCAAYCHALGKGDIVIPPVAPPSVTGQYLYPMPGFSLTYFQAYLFIPIYGFGYTDPPGNLIAWDANLSGLFSWDDSGVYVPSSAPTACNWNTH